DLAFALAVARQERRLRLRVGDVHAADPGQQELASDRGHGVEQLDPCAARRQHFGGHQPGGAATDDGDVGSGASGGVGHGGAGSDVKAAFYPRLGSPALSSARASGRVWASSQSRARAMSGLYPSVDPEGLLEYSVVYTDRSLNHMSQSFQGVMRDISSTL